MRKASQAKEKLIDYVKQHRLAKKYKLPAERILACELGYSRGTIGKALGVLESEGLIVKKHGAGTFIAEEGKSRSITFALVMRNAYHCTDSHFRLLVDQLSKYAEKNDIYIQIFDRLQDMFSANPNNNPLMDAINNKSIDGVLITSRMPPSIIGQIVTACPVVSINNIFGGGNEIPCISCDYFRTGFLAGKYLLEKGHRDIAYITATFDHAEPTMEYSGFTCALEMAGIKPSDENVLECGYNTNTFQTRTTKFFAANEYTACFVRTSINANRVFSFLQKKGIRVPEDFTIIATGNYKSNINALNKIVLIDNHLDEMCKWGIETLNRRITGKKHFVGLKLISPTLIEKNKDFCRQEVLTK
jgi:DNA-binding LacI/PurR family transcriptional regulator